MMQKMSRIAILASITALLSACVGPGSVVRIPLTDENGRPATLVAHNQMVPDSWLDRDQLALNFLVRGDVSEKQLVAVAEAEKACRIFTGTVRPSNLVAVLNSGVIYAIAGATGLYFGSAAFTGATQAYRNQSAEYGAWASGTGGVANGLITLGGQTYTFENCSTVVITKLFPNAGVSIIQKAPY